ncbi:AT-hook motif nuclear-localized protein 1 [Perilla frutescens var. hirtella]|uniref:AT-hook motif nuclear-localized protein n=1 Tax=Perilla frutescens var. hirtella TaxID=608512 RepID=A0AAD4J706_PERFH|nr:AT-hook motif nuclear-localized protein 1 [Perilla frutescens var. frutescens]KAH6828395.1 AT-hook motif nuclear-localized protein 1 [Perilla frutescens var. hirtella]
MEEKEGINGSGVTVRGDEAPQSYRVEPRVENSGKFDGSAAPPAAAAPPSASDGKKKRGRPRKYAAGGGSVVALSPMPISASIPLTGDYSGWKQSGGRPVDSFKKKHKLDFANAGSTMPSPVGGSFTPHMITVNSGEDIMMKIISFSQQGSRAICILAANGTISNVTLRQPNSSGGTLTYEGRFEILSLTGSFMPSDNGLTKSRSGGLSVSLAGPDGRVLGGGLAGMLVAAGPVQIVIGSFVPGGQQQPEQKQPKKPKYEQTISFGPITANPGSEAPYGGAKPNMGFHGDNLALVNSIHGGSNNRDDSREQSHELTC